MIPDKENVSEKALAGFCKALPSPRPDVDLLNIHADTGYPTDLKTTKIYRKLATRVARGPVLGVISFLTSPDSPPVVRFCRTMQIPLLLSVAANDDLMAQAEDTHGIVFRMMPTNGRQAQEMATFLKEKVNHRKFRVAVFHEPNPFGEFLQRKLEHWLLPETQDRKILLYNFEVTDQLEFHDLIPQLGCEQLDMIVYLGFASRAKDLLNKLRWYQPDKDQVTCRKRDPFKGITVLLASGAYEEELHDAEKYSFPFKVFAMLSTTPDPSQDVEKTAAFEYGYDSYALIESLADQKFKIPSQPIKNAKTGHDYRFDEDGELSPAVNNTYQAYPVEGKL